MPPFILLQDELWLRLLAGLLVGLALGSFTTMLSYRLPRQLSIIMPRSQCPKCHTALQARDLVPVVSWLMAHGRCRACGKEIGVRYVMIELATTAVSLFAFALIGFRPALIAALTGIVVIVTLVTIWIEDGGK